VSHGLSAFRKIEVEFIGEHMISKRENLLRILTGKVPAFIPVECLPYPQFGEGAYTFVTYRGALPPSGGGTDLWGAIWEARLEKELPYITRTPFASVEEVLSADFTEIRNPSLWEAACSTIAAEKSSRVMIGRQVSCLWERLAALVGMETALEAVAFEPERVEAALKKISGWQVAAAEKFIEIGVDAVRISDDYGTQDSLLISPAAWRTLIRPALSRLMEVYRQAGIPVILHSCGNLRLIMDDLVNLGFAAFNIQTNANPLADYFKTYGERFCLWGGVSTQAVLALGSPEQVEAAVIQALNDYAKEGRLVLEPDQFVEMPLENLQRYVQVALEYRTKVFQ